MKSLKALWILPLILAAFMVGCPTGGDEYTLRAVELTAGTAVDVEADDTTAEVSFTGASGLTLANEDFTVSEGGTIVSVEVSGDTVTVTVSFAANADTSAEKAYTVGISPDSQVIKGDAAVTITQGYAGDTRRALTAGQPVTVSAADTSAYVVFTGAAGLSTVGGGGEDPLVGSEDFTVNNGAVVSSVAVVEDTVTVTISFAANTGTTEQTYTAGISPDSTVIKGSGTVTITQSGVVLLNAFYVSFSTGNDENAGTEGAPWKTIAKVNSRTYQAGDAILFKRGDTWTWSDGEPSLAPPGSGAEGNPIRISSYGTGAKPVFEGKGLVDNVIHLHNQQYWEISDLEISSMVEGWTNPMARDDTQGNLIKNKDLRAVYISGDNGQVLSGFNLHDLYIHDVTGELNWIGGGAYINNPNPVPFFPGSNNQTGWDASKTTGAIVFYALLGDGVNATTFNNIIVEDSVFLRNSFCAVTTKQCHGGSSGTKWAERTVTTYPYADPNFKPHTNIIVRGNYIDQTGYYHGDGIYLTSVQGALVEKNVVKDPGVCGIELYYCDGITVQHNEVYGSTAKGGGNDKNGIDPDVKTSNIIIQYNYVHDNGDGFLICGGAFNTVIIRHNVLYNNTKMWVRDVVSGGFIQVYNNIFYNTTAQTDTVGTIKFTSTTSSLGGSELWEFKNNVFYNAHAGTTSSSFLTNANYSYSNNLYYGVTPPGSPSVDPAAVAAVPAFTGAPAFSTGDSAANRFQDFSLLKPGAGSPLINRGVAYSAPESPKRIDVEPNGLDYDGVPVGVADIGLYAANFNGLSGVVTNMLDEGVSGAVVKLNETIQTTTDGNGKYSFATVSPGAYTITVSAESYMGSTISFTAEADAVSWLPLDAGDYTGSAVKDVTGTVTSGAAPLAGATVAITKNDSPVSQTTTGVDGTYTLEDIPAGNGYTVTASKEGYESKSIVDFVIPLVGEPESANFDLISATHVYYNEDFDTLDDWTVSGGTNHTVEIIVDPDNAGNNLLHINKSSGGAGGIFNKTNAGAYGVFTVETRMKRSISDSSGTGQFHLYTYQSDKFTGSGSANPSANIVLVGGQIKTHFSAGSSTVTNIQAYTADTWYKITLKIDTATDTFVFYVNEVQKGTGSIRTAVNTIDIFNLASGGTGSGFGDFWVDYIKVYQGEPEFLGN